MGITEMGKVCNTCGLTNKDCPGHFGHIELAKPFYSYQFIDTSFSKSIKMYVLNVENYL